MSDCYSLPDMRAAAIFGLNSITKDLRPFRKDPKTDWQIGLPRAPKEADAILIFGGDGTVHRYLSQLIALQLPVLIVPCGSGNDFARALGLRNVRDSLKAWQHFESGERNLRRIDLGIIHQLDAGKVPTPHRYFCCVGGIGLDADVARRANQLPPWLRGHGAYVASLLPALFHFAALPMKVSATTPAGELRRHCVKPILLAAFANAPTYGGGMRIAPKARMDDGLLDLCIVSDIDRFKLFCLFPTVYFGRHLNRPEIEYLQTERLRIETDHPLDVYADGEYVCRTPIEVTVAKKALSVIVHSSHTSF